MTFKEFKRWCNERACDGCWDYITALVCIDIIENISALPFWKRKAEWAKFESRVMLEIVDPINRKIRETLNKA